MLIPQRLTRRKFINTTAKAAAAVSIVSLAPYVARGRVLGANDRIGIGFIGVGGRGRSHPATVQKLIESGVNLQIVAVCDAYGYRREQAAELTGARIHKRHSELLADEEVDAVCIATPDRLHVPQALDAIRAGRDVYCEKPMGHWSQFELSKKFYQETSRLQRVVQIGNQANSVPRMEKGRRSYPGGRRGAGAACGGGLLSQWRFWRTHADPADPRLCPAPILIGKPFSATPQSAVHSGTVLQLAAVLGLRGRPEHDLFPHLLTPFVSMLG